MIPTGFYTLVLDIFPTEKLLDSQESAAKRYVNILRNKRQLQSTKDSWARQVLETSDIFTPILAEEKEQQLSEEFEQLTLESKLEEGIDIDQDYRFANIEVTPVDMTSTAERSSEPIKARSIGNGVIRLYREWEKREGVNLDDDTDENAAVVEGDSTMVAIVAVPSYFTATDLLGFVGENARNNVSHFRLIRSQTPNRFMVLMKFKNEANANVFIDEFNGKNFNSMEPETCSVIRVSKVLLRNYQSGNTARDTKRSSSLPFLLPDPFTTPSLDKPLSKPLPPPQMVLSELPTCPVCLERMDASVTGLLTIPCQHTFHCQCLSKWRDDSCPVCRYTSRFEKFRDDEEQDQCAECHSTQNLWMCLICGNIGCSRYDSAHAVDHFERTSHCFALDINSQRVWDYAGDNYVHRLLQNMDGKLVELPSRDEKTAEGSSRGTGGIYDTDKTEKITMEYTKLLTSQLESQREYYESIIRQQKEMPSEIPQEQIKQLEEKLEKAVAKQQMQNKILNEYRTKYVNEKTLNKALSERIEYLQGMCDELKKTSEDLREQVNDVMFYLKAQDTLKDAGEDVTEGQVIVKEAPKKKKRGKR